MNTGLKKLLAGVGALSATVALLLIGTGEASAASNAGTVIMCTDANFQGNCLFVTQGDSYGDPVKDWPHLVAPGGNVWQDSISSIENNTGLNYCFYADNNFQGRVIAISPNGRDTDLGSSQPALQDSISSMRPC
jgi:Peptidase inhibitor family I36